MTVVEAQCVSLSMTRGPFGSDYDTRVVAGKIDDCTVAQNVKLNFLAIFFF